MGLRLKLSRHISKYIYLYIFAAILLLILYKSDFLASLNPLFALLAAFLIIIPFKKMNNPTFTASELLSVGLLISLAVAILNILALPYIPDAAKSWMMCLIYVPGMLISAYIMLIVGYRERLLVGKIWLTLMVLAAGFVAFIHSNSYFFLPTILLFIGFMPFHWRRSISRKETTHLAIIAFLVLAAYFLPTFINLSAAKTMPDDWGSFGQWVLSMTASLSRAVSWFVLLYGLSIPLKPRHIRTRMRWAFLLNFIVPTVLIICMFGLTLIYLIGGYQSAAAKRLLFRIGMQAHEQAEQLWEAVNGINQEAPAPMPFHRAGIVIFQDGSVQTFGEPPTDLIANLKNESLPEAEFISITEGEKWELWVAGFYKAPDDSGTCIGYRVDNDMLRYFHEVLGFHFSLTPGLDWGFMPFLTSKSDHKHISSIDTQTKTDSHKLFNIGAIMISNANVDKTQPSPTFIIEPYATLSVLANRSTLASSLVTTGSFSDLKTMIHINGPQMRVKFDEVNDISTIDVQSMNILNFIIFIILSLAGGLLAGMIILSLSTSFLISRKITHSVGIIEDGANELRRGNLDHRIPVTSQDELGRLATEFNRMTMSLKQLQEEREEYLVDQMEQKRLRQEFETARLIQRSLLPHADPKIEQLDVTGICQPMEAVGGDYFDYIFFPDRSFGLAIGDVSGHGMSAGLLMSMAKSCLYNQVRVSFEVDDVFKAMNSMVYGAMRQRLLMTFLYAIFSPDGRNLRFASAGHHFPYIFRKRTQKLEELPSISYPLGVREKIHIQVNEVDLEPDDVLIFYTDGIIECQNPRGELFGYERLEHYFKHYHDYPVTEIKDALIRRMNMFRKESAIVDDVTLVIVRIKGSENV